MNVNFMQRVDFWVGIPLCAICSGLQRLRSLFIQSKSSNKPKKILFIELSEMGSAILAYPSMRRAKEAHSAELYFITFRRNVESVSLLGLIPEKNIIVIEDTSFIAFAASITKALLYLRRLRIDTTIDCELFSRCTSLLTFLIAADRRVGFHKHTNEGLYRGEFLTHKVLYNPHQHMSSNFMALVVALEADLQETPLLKEKVDSIDTSLPALRADTAKVEKVLCRLKERLPSLDPNAMLIALNPDPGALPLRGWPMERFISLSQLITEKFPNSVIVIVGLERSKSYAQKIQERLGSKLAVDMTGQTDTMEELTILLNQCRLLVTNDSGPAHLASLTKTSSIVMFGPETPRLYGPLSPKTKTLYANLACSPCYSAANHRRTQCKNNLCLQAISIEQVMTAVEQELTQGS